MAAQPAFARRRGIGVLLEALLQARGLSRAASPSAREHTRETRRNWTAVPCGTDSVMAERHTREYLEEVERYRYRTQPWTAEAIAAAES